MPINLKEAPTKDLLQRTNIRTMKKDLAALREADSLEEKQKISKIVIQPEPLKTASSQPIKLTEQEEKEIERKVSQLIREVAPQPIAKNEPLVSLNQEVKKEVVAEVQPKKEVVDTEAQKQQIFLLQSQRAELEKQLEEFDQESDTSLMIEKNKILTEKEHWQKKLDDILQAEKENEKEQETIEHKEETSHSVAKKHTLEKELETKEGQFENMEKKRWLAEGELEKLEAKIKNLEEGNKESQAKQENIKKEIAKIDDSLKMLQGNVLKVEQEKSLQSKVSEQHSFEAKKPELKEMFTQKAQVSSAPISVPAPVREEKKVQEPPLASKPAFVEIPKVAIEKLEKSTEVEEKQRRKFMEDVEAWIASSKNNQ